MRANRFHRLGALVGALFDAHVRRSPAFEKFRREFCADRESAPGRLDLEALAALAGRDRRLAERMLLNALPDVRAVVGLGELATPRAGRRLASLFEEESARAQEAAAAGRAEGSGALLIATAAALWRIEPDARYARAVVERLRRARSWSERVDAAVALARMPTGQVDEALTEALDDRDALVRHHAARSLLAIHGVEVDARATHCMIYRVMEAAAEGRSEGLRDIATALAGHPLLRDAGAPGQRNGRPGQDWPGAVM